MKKGIALLAMAMLMVTAYTQNTFNKCASVDVIDNWEQRHPGYKAGVKATFDATKQLAEMQKANRAADDTVYYIQCVFHIVYTNADENIDDSIVYSQIDVLNEDYRRLNADTSKTREIFADIVGDSRIQFELASVDPNGNPTTGITRTLGTPVYTLPILGSTYMVDSDDVKSAARGGVNPWPTDRYLNIWVCELAYGFGLLGYAYPPTGAINWPAGSDMDSTVQGVALHYPVVGRNYPQPIDATVAKGRSAVHEIGHYLGLRHIWGDGDCSEDDGLADTPDAAAANQQTCDTSKNTCTESPVEYPDMIENYMDYSDDRCLNAFTKDQIAIMRGTLQTSRYGIARRVLEVDTVTTSINNVKIETTTVSVYPNPTQGIVNFDVQMEQGIGYNIVVYNIVGDLVYASPSSSLLKNGMIDLSSKPAGIYYAKFIVGEQTFTKRLQIIR